MKNFKKGQSTIEFIFVFFAFIFFLSMSYNAVVSFAVYQYLSYAHFMAIRAYHPSRQTRLGQRDAAIRVMNVYVPGVEPEKNLNVSFAFSAKRPLAKIKKWELPYPDTPNLPAILTFEVPFITLPLGDEIKQSFGSLTLKTSIYVGREPSKEECLKFFVDKFGEFGGGGPHGPDAMEDNGC